MPFWREMGIVHWINYKSKWTIGGSTDIGDFLKPKNQKVQKYFTLFALLFNTR